MERPKRKRKATVFFDNSEAALRRDTWSLKEKQTLLDAIKKHGKDNTAKLAQALKASKTPAQIQKYIQKLLSIQAKREKPPKAAQEAPIQAWMRLASDLTKDSADYSDIIANVLSVSGSLEPHVPPKGKMDADFFAIYRYLAGLLRGDSESDLPKLNRVSSTILLDMLQSLADTLQSLDLNPQYELMTEKYRLLKEKAVITNRQHHESTRKALENDFGTASAMTDETPPNTETNTEPSSKKRKGPGRPRMKQRRPSLSSCSAEPQNQQADSANSSLTLQRSSGQNIPVSATAGMKVAATSQQIQLTLPQGIKLSPGAYKLNAKDLQALMASLNNKVKQAGAPPLVQSGAKAAGVPSQAVEGVQTGLQSGAKSGSVRNQVVEGGQSPAMEGVQSGANLGDVQSDAVEGVQSCAKSGTMQSQDTRIAQAGQQSEPQSETQSTAKQRQASDLSVQSAANPELSVGNNLQSGANQNPGHRDNAPSTQGAANYHSSNSTHLQNNTNLTSQTLNNLQVLDKVVVSANQGKKRARPEQDGMLPKQTQLYSLNPFCIPVRYLKPNPRTEATPSLKQEEVEIQELGSSDDPEPETTSDVEIYEEPVPGTFGDPGTYGEPVPGTSGDPVTYGEPVPGTSGDPVTYGEPVPGTSGDPVIYGEPVPGISGEPVTYGEPVRGTSGDPVTIGEPVPGTSGDPETSGEPVPGTSGNPLPETSGDSEPSMPVDPAPGASGST